MYRLTLAIHGTGIGKCGFKLLLKVCQQNWSRFSGNVCKDFNCFNERKAAFAIPFVSGSLLLFTLVCCCKFCLLVRWRLLFIFRVINKYFSIEKVETCFSRTHPKISSFIFQNCPNPRID